MARIRGGLLLVILVCVAPGVGHADDFKLIPYARARVEYNDNLFFSREVQLDDIIVTLTPGLDIINRTERLYLGLFGHLDFLNYDEFKDLDNTDQFYSGEISYQFTELTSAFVEGGYTKDSRPDRDIETTGQVLGNNIRDRLYVSAGGDIGFTETSSLGLYYAYEQNEWDTESLVDSRINSGTIGYIHHLGAYLPRTILRFNLGFADYRFDTSKTQSFSATIGFSRDHHELWQVLFNIGGRYVETEFEVEELEVLPGPPFFQIVTRTEKTNDLGGIGELKVIYGGERTRFEISAGQDLREDSGQGRVVWRTSGILFFRYFIIEDFSFRLHSSYFYNQAKEGELSREDVKEQTFTVRPGFRFDITRNLFIEATYAHTWKDDIADDVITTRNLVYGELRWQVPIFE